MLQVIPVILGAERLRPWLFLVSGCSKTEAPENRKETPEKETCIPSEYSDSYVKVEGGFKLSQGEAETICNIRKTDDVANLERQYYDCAVRLNERGKYQPANSILNSLWVSTENQYLETLVKNDLESAEFFAKYSKHPCFFDPFDWDRGFWYLRSLKNFTEPLQDSFFSEF